MLLVTCTTFSFHCMKSAGDIQLRPYVIKFQSVVSFALPFKFGTKISSGLLNLVSNQQLYGMNAIQTVRCCSDYTSG